MQRLIEYIGNHPVLAGAAVVIAIVAIVMELRARANSFMAISPQDAIRLMNQNALVLDLRPPEAFAAGHLAGARNLPFEQIGKAGETLKKYKEKPIVVYCETGATSGSAARKLAEQGFTKVVNLRGGLQAWRAENLPVTRS
ncbi:MAG TPA: rhodanese-like domain-containing protein [Steroidobacteraceae bacterium]|nr:rhodanese-like domain-containing protein [Steroidobacteraceae bacterium]